MEAWRPGVLVGPCALAVLVTTLVAAGEAGALQQTDPVELRGTAPGPAAFSLQAVRVERPPEIDGVLDEPFWASIEPTTEFLQRDPVDGAPASERTEVRVAYDEGHLYFGLTLFDSQPHRIRRSILQREGPIHQDDRVIIALDTYHDRRNAYIFELNPYGTQGDALLTDEAMTHDAWNWEGVYRSEGRITDEGWVLEVAIPFTTIRFAAGETPRMGIAFYRSIRRKNEDVTWPHIPQRFNQGIFQVSRYGTLTGLQDLRRGRYIELKPFAIAGGRKEGAGDTDGIGDVGLDLKYAITSNLTLDVTANTDFAQVEADNVQINLTRFNLFFPEKREFFLERAGLFTFGDPREAEVFFSRRIGITNEILGGARLTGQVGPVSVGFLSLQTEDAGDVKGANNTVLRVRADPFDRATVGGIFTNLQNGDFHNRVAGLDGVFRFWSSSSFRFWGANVWDSRAGGPVLDGGEGTVVDDGPPAGTDTESGALELILRNERYMMEAALTRIGRDYDPGIGFVGRPDQIRFGGQLGFTPRFEGSTWARQLFLFLQGNHIMGTDREKQSHFRRVNTHFSFQSRDLSGLTVTEQFERLEDPFPIRPDAVIPTGDYTFRSASAFVQTNDARPVAGNMSLSVGDFYSGTRTQWSSWLAWRTGPHLSLRGSVSRNDISLPVENGDFSTTIFGLNVAAAVSRDLFANALLQYDDVSETFQANIRFDWIHTPGSDLFVVLDTGYFIGDLLLDDPRATRWQRRGGVVKLTYLKAF